MKVKTYVLAGATVLLYISAASQDVRYEGITPGDLAPGIKSLGNKSDLCFHNSSNRYTLLNFWASYDAESRARNVELANKVSSLDDDKIALCSVSFDENPSVFSGIIKIDKLSRDTQFNDVEGKKSALYRKYNLKKGFTNFLIDRNGIIVAKGITPEELANLIN
ncbi:MAG: thioredoxin family protein [Tannerellaceae bacterium]|jgi:hypothetical protein|nr:thioredoxin family protein [Tannerellaceae bacterium]